MAKRRDDDNHVFECSLESERHKTESRTKGICSPNTYFYQTATGYVPKRFTNLMCIICKPYFIDLYPHTLLL